MALITFSCTSPLAAWSPSVNPSQGGGYKRGKERFQPIDFSDGGTIYSYSRGSVLSRILEWNMLPAADMDGLLHFLDLISGVKVFTFTDYDASAFTKSRVLNFHGLPYKNQTLEYFSVTLELEVAA